MHIRALIKYTAMPVLSYLYNIISDTLYCMR